jgi:hypothetical protein
MDNKAELVIQALQQRIGELVSQYETHIAVLRAEITQLSDILKSQEVPAEQPKE